MKEFEDEVIDCEEIGEKFSLTGGIKRVFNIGDCFVVVDQLGCQKLGCQEDRVKGAYKNFYRLRINGYIDIYYVEEGPVQGLTTQLEILDDKYNCVEYYQVPATEVDETVESFLNSLPEVQP